MPSATISSKGQVTIPKEVRDSLSIGTGDRIAFEIRDDGVVEIHPETVDLLSLCGIIKPKVRGITIERMKADIVKAAAKK
jgi:AbrB family looped-hinge helix DNA binding protein